MGFLKSLEIDKPKSFNLTDVLDYTPSNLEPLYQQFNSKQNKGWGFKKTVSQEFEDFEGLGKGRIYISDDKEKGTITKWVPYMGKEWVDKQNLKIMRASTLVNAPIHLAPLIAPFAARTQPSKIVIKDPVLTKGQKVTGILPGSTGGRTLLQQRSLNKYRKQFKEVDNNLTIQNLQNVTPVTPQKGTEIINNAFSRQNGIFTRTQQKQIPSYENRPVYIPPNERIGTQKGEPLQSTINPDDAYQNLRSIKRAWNSQLTQGGRSRRFNLKAFLNNNREDYKRLVSGDWSTTWDTGLAVGRSRENLSRQTAYDNRRTELLNIFREDYGEALERLEIPERRINLDHKLTLVQSVGMYHNVERNSPLHISIQNIALNRGYTPGDAEANLDLADPESHRVKTNFFNDLHGLKNHNNMKYWNGLHRDTGKTRFQIMDESHKSPEAEALHLEVVEDYFDVVDRGTIILNDAKQVWKAENLTGIMPEGITDELMKVIVDPDFKNYTSETLKPVIESIIYEEIANIKTLQRVLEIEGELEKLDMLTSAETILPEDSAHVKELKKELKKLKTPFKSKWFKKEYEKSLKDQQKGLDIFGYDRLLNDIFRIDE